MGVNTAIEELRQEEQELLSKLESAKALEEKLSQVQSALCALGERPAGKQFGKGKKPSTTRQDVVDALVAILSTKGSGERDDLKQIVETRLRDSGRNLQGFPRRFDEALALEQFTNGPKGISLAGADADSGGTNGAERKVSGPTPSKPARVSKSKPE